MVVRKTSVFGLWSSRIMSPGCLARSYRFGVVRRVAWWCRLKGKNAKRDKLTGKSAQPYVAMEVRRRPT